MSRVTPAGLAALALVGAAALALSACGKTGALQRPAPLFGQGRDTSRAADDQTRQVQDPSRPVNTVDPRDQTTDPRPSRTTPIQGQSPDPYANPQR
jgi:hypothetical protein